MCPVALLLINVTTTLIPLRMGAASSVDRVAPEGTRDVKTALKKGLDSGLSQALNASAPAAHPEWRQVAPAVSEILQSIAKDMLAVAGKNQSAVVLDMRWWRYGRPISPFKREGSYGPCRVRVWIPIWVPELG